MRPTANAFAAADARLGARLRAPDEFLYKAVFMGVFTLNTGLLGLTVRLLAG